MGRVWFTPEQIIGKLREAEVLLSLGTNIDETDHLHFRTAGFPEKSESRLCFADFSDILNEVK